MPEALARSDFDFSLKDYAHSPARAYGAPSSHQDALTSFLARCLNYPMSTLAFLMLVGIVGSFLVNALFLQNARHPAPLFGRDSDISNTASRMPQADKPSVPLPSPRPAEVQPSVATNNVPAVVAAVPTPNVPASRTRSLPAQPVIQDSADPKARDQIALLLRGGLTPQTHSGGPAGNGQSSTTDQAKSILAAQKALVKLGYVLKPDGMMGAGTRSAIEQYERDQGMIVRGDLTPRMMRELANKSGITAQ